MPPRYAGESRNTRVGLAPRDMGYAVGALSAGIIADAFGISWAIGSVGALTFLSGAVVAVSMREDLGNRAETKKAAAR